MKRLCSAWVFVKHPVMGRPRRDLTASLAGAGIDWQIDRLVYELH